MPRRRSFDPQSSDPLRGLVSPPLPVLSGLALARALVREIEDRRRFYPSSFRPVGSVLRADRQLVEAPHTPRAMGRFSFAAPNRVAICVRRKTRREVLFATRQTGKGAKSPRRRNHYSDIGCK